MEADLHVIDWMEEKGCAHDVVTDHDLHAEGAALLAPYRVLHFVIIAFFVTRFVPKEWPGLEWRIFEPVVKCGQQSLAVFCVGVFLSFVAHFLLIMSSGSLLAQIGVSFAGIFAMTVVAYYISWSKQQDKPRPKPSAAAPPADSPAAPAKRADAA